MNRSFDQDRAEGDMTITFEGDGVQSDNYPAGSTWLHRPDLGMITINDENGKELAVYSINRVICIIHDGE